VEYKGKTISVILLSVVVLCLFSDTLLAADDVSGEKRLMNPFFVLDNGTKDAKHNTPKSQAEMLKELGYAGIGYSGVKGIAEMLKALDENGLKMFTIYVGVWLDPDKQKYEPQLKEAIRLLKGRDTIIWLHIRSRKYKPSSPEGDPRAVEIVREIADMAQESGLRVALYPHSGFWVERVEDAVRVVKKVNRKNVGATFNLCHWLKVDEEKNMRPLMKLAMPYLFVVTINGADSGGKDWEHLIQTLDSGSFDIYKFLRTLKELGYTGPIGLQCYGIGGDAHENLKRSMKAWRELSARIGVEWIGLLRGGDFSAWREPVGEWKIVGDAFKDPNNERRLAWKPGTGVAVNGVKGRTNYLFTKMEHGDIEAHIEFMVPKGSNSGVYFQGRYEIQVLDSWGVKRPEHSDCGGIYQRWDENRSPKGYEGHPPRVNASLPPGQWQSYDVIFRSPRFDESGKKIANARFEKVVHNGVVVHENVELTGPTRASAYDDEKPAGPIMLQGDHGPVAYRSIWIRKLP